MGKKVNEFLASEAKRLRKEAAAMQRKDAEFHAVTISRYLRHAERMEAELGQGA